jgi:hypothetical protein
MENKIKIKNNIKPKFFEQLGYENYLVNEYHWFETYEKHIKDFTNIIIGVDDGLLSIKYDDDFEYKWYDFDEMMLEPEIKFLLDNGYVEVYVDSQ